MSNLKDQFDNIFREVYILVNDEFVKLGVVEENLWKFICDNYTPIKNNVQKEIDIDVKLDEIVKIKFN